MAGSQGQQLNDGLLGCQHASGNRLACKQRAAAGCAVVLYGHCVILLKCLQYAERPLLAAPVQDCCW
jgi:hypothetical protein